MRHFATILPVWLLFAGLATPARAGEAEVRRFLDEYTRAAERLEAHYGRMSGTCRILDQEEPDSKRFYSTDAEFAVDRDAMKVTFQDAFPPDKDATKVEYVFCVTQGEAFQLERKAGAQDYLVRGLGAEKLRGEFNWIYGQFLKAPYSVLGVPLSRIMRGPGFRLDSAETVAGEGGRELIRIAIEYEEPPKNRAVVSLDPSAGWVIRHGEVTLGKLHHAKITFVNTYKSLADGLPAPDSALIHNLDRRIRRMEFGEVGFGPTPAREFTAEFYKVAIPGPIAGPDRGGTAPILIGLAIAGLAASMALRRAASSRRVA